MDNHEAEIELEAVLDTLVDGVIIINALGVMSLFNPACEKMFGYEPGEVIGQNVKMLMPEPYQTEHDTYLKNYKDTAVKKIIGIGREVRGKRKNGSIFPMDLSVGESSLEGKPIFVGIIRDLTKRHEERRKYEHLQEEHFHLSRVSAMNEMGSAIAHELNQPIAASINYTETAKLIIERGGTLDTDKLMSILNRAVEQTHRASDIISRMRGFIERGDVEKAPQNIRDIAETSVRLAFLGLDNQDIALTYDIKNDIPLVFVNSIQIQQVFVNLIKNACEAMFDSPQKDLLIRATLSDSGDYVSVSVIDTGRGLTEKDIETLFVPFSSQKSEGMGVGLSISQSIITHNGGQLWAQPHNPVGSVFHFTLPVVPKG